MHDKNGHPLAVGDLVTLTGRITHTSEGDLYCNISFESVEPMYPGTSKSFITLNARQVEYVPPDLVITPSLDKPVISAL